jgi:hypothetical protein
MAHGSIGNMTNTLIETGARHMQQCRTNYDVLLAMAGGEENLLGNDDKWCLAKDELVVSCGKNMLANSVITGNKHAYPSVVTTLGDMTPEEKKLIATHYHFMSEIKKRDGIKKDIVAGLSTDTSKCKQYREFMPVGYSVGRACAHSHKGDTVASVQIGGLRTVINGEFGIQTGDMVQMYIPSAESFMFNKDGGRMKVDDTMDMDKKLKDAVTNLDSGTKQRKDFYSRGLGIANGKGDRVKGGMFSIKPYMESLNEDAIPYQGDKMRVFAKALSSARPYEPVDIMIARQAL